ncbi:hypothetical protein EV1_036464 [Malus domestica]
MSSGFTRKHLGGKGRRDPLSRHIKKRALKNKALVVTFNEKELSDFVSGFPKRKKKRRKEAEKKQGEALRRKRLELRKKVGIYGSADEVDEGVEEHEDDEISETSGAANPCCRSPYNVYFSLPTRLPALLGLRGSGSCENIYELIGESTLGFYMSTTTYDNGEMKVTVTTHEIFREEESDRDKKTTRISWSF